MGKKVAEIFGKPLNCLSLQPDERWPLPKQPIGLEFEYENAPLSSWPSITSPLWNFFLAKEDGSLRDNGLELAYNSPSYGKDISDSLEALSKECKISRWVVNARTGLHVHLDVRDMDQEDLFRLFQIYALFEYILFKFVGDARESSNFCVPWFRCSEQFRAISTLTRTIQENSRAQRTFGDLTRYVALNVASLTKFGSLEFRHMQNTLDFDRIHIWIKLVMLIKRAALALNFEKDELLIEISKAGPEGFLQKVFLDQAPVLLGCYGSGGSQGFEDDFFKGLEMAQDLVISTIHVDPFKVLPFLQANELKGPSPGLAKFLIKHPATFNP